METPDLKDEFHNATCYLPNYIWENIICTIILFKNVQMVIILFVHFL